MASKAFFSQGCPPRKWEKNLTQVEIRLVSISIGKNYTTVKMIVMYRLFNIFLSFFFFGGGAIVLFRWAMAAQLTSPTK